MLVAVGGLPPFGFLEKVCTGGVPAGKWLDLADIRFLQVGGVILGIVILYITETRSSLVVSVLRQGDFRLEDTYI